MNQMEETAKKLFDCNYFAVYNHVQMGTVERDKVSVYLDMVPESTNQYGSIHGGALFMLSDAASGMAARTDGRKYVTQQSNVYYMRGCTEGRVTATATVVKRGKTTCIIEARVTDENDKLLFMGNYSFFCTGDAALEGKQD